MENDYSIKYYPHLTGNYGDQLYICYEIKKRYIGKIETRRHWYS